ncbi:DNA-processing protein DprA [Heyndrickxia coagulans]|uniref:DNA-processing protein DprA n=1 Tax=Heyndrickxia coagulans TaxID=1398 RepID=UPI001A94C6D5|nr:DNA-processing protein DprA [Heyndrickxia coagulans]
MNDFFWTTLSCVKGVGSKTLTELYENNPFLDFDNLYDYLETEKKKSLFKLLSFENIQLAKDKAEKLLAADENEGIKVIPISSEWYPNYLRLIPDPPTILFAKGNIELLKEKQNLAVVGTREPTVSGIKAAQKIAMTFAEMGYTIVSGLALGIDTAGHVGSLLANNGKTIAVLAGNLTEIYPAKNKQLAMEILEKDGLWLSETPIGQANMRGNFVKRDRIQSGLSIGVCPVQTPVKGGTQHTIEYARKQNRFLFTPIPLAQDQNENAIQGNLELIKSGVYVLKDKDSYQTIHQMLQEKKERLDLEHKNRFEKKQSVKPGLENDIEQLSLFD